VHRQVTLSHPPGGRLPLLSTRPAVTSVAFRQMAPHGSTSDSSSLLIYRPRKDDRLSWSGWLTCSEWFLPTIMVIHLLQVDHRTGKVRRPVTDVLPLCHATNRIPCLTRTPGCAPGRTTLTLVNNSLQLSRPRRSGPDYRAKDAK